MKRFLLFLLALALLPGCGPGPKSAKAAPAVSAAAQKLYDSEFARLTSENATTHDKLDGIGVKLDLVQATIDALSTPEEPVPQTPAEKLSKTFGEIDEALSIEAAPEPEPPQLDTPAAAPRFVTVDGQSVDYDSFVDQWFKGPAFWKHWTVYVDRAGRETKVQNDVTQHLKEDHGVKAAELALLSDDEKEALHSAIHEKEEAAKSAKAKSKVVVRGPAPAAPAVSACPNGMCPLQAQQPRYGLFGRQRSFSRRR